MLVNVWVVFVVISGLGVLWLVYVSIVMLVVCLVVMFVGLFLIIR